MKSLLPVVSILLVCLLSISSANAQRSCGTSQSMQSLLESDPSFATKRQQIETFTSTYVAHNQLQTVTTEAPIFNIPVVVHIIYNPEMPSANISDEQVFSQIDVLNKDYQMQNTDGEHVPAVFQNLRANAQIQFCLAQKDPNGNPTSGITRRANGLTNANLSNNAKSYSSGGVNPWPADRYMNVWVVPQLQGGILAYAQMPGVPASIDGIVIDHKYFGTMGSAQSPYNKGRTLTHEVGHFLNLYHIWGDDVANSEYMCTGTDYCDDTPNQGVSSSGCPSFPQVSCNNGPNGDLFMNFMDYTDDACMNMFTNDQKLRMHAVLAVGGARHSLTQSDACQPAQAGSCSTPSNDNVSNISYNSARIGWSNTEGGESYNIDFRKQGETTWNTTYNITFNFLVLQGLEENTMYEYRIMTNCSNNTQSAYSIVKTFQTKPRQNGCGNNFEYNNIKPFAKTLQTDTTYYSMIATSNDLDYFVFKTTNARPKLHINLGELPADYDMRFYNYAGALIMTSQMSGIADENIIYNNYNLGTKYYIRVSGYSGNHNSTNCYKLRINTSNAQFRESATPTHIANDPKRFLEITENQDKNNFSFKIFAHEEANSTLDIFDQAGRLVQSKMLVLTKGINTQTIDVSMLNSGLYIVKLNFDEQVLTSKLSLIK